MRNQDKKPWHEQDVLWEKMQKALFTRKRMEVIEEETDQLIELLEMKPDDDVLDLCCGIGRFSNELSRRGYRVTGVDRTEAYLKQAREIATKEGLTAEYIHMDMREFRRDNSFDVVINIFTSFGYFEDEHEQMVVIDNIRKSLRPGGRLIIELMGKEVLARKFRESDWSEGEYGIHLEQRKPIEDWSKIQNIWTLIEKDGTRHEWDVTHYLYSAVELKSILSEAGFQDIKVYGGLDGSPYDLKARRLAVIGIK